jgi:hypothetical protein
MNTIPSRYGALAAAALPKRKSPAAAVAQHQPLRVLQTGRAPAQLSLFLRPGVTSR